MKFPALLSVLALSAILVSGCESAYKHLSAEPLPPTSFLPEPQRLVRQQASFPFNYLWYEKSLDWERFKKIKFDRVDLSHMLAASWWQNFNEAKVKDMRKDAEGIGEYMRNAFIREIIADSRHSFAMTDKVDSETVVIQLAIVQLVPTKAFMNAVTSAADFVIPGASLLSMANAGSVAMECRILDGRDGKVVAMLADRESDPARMISMANFTWYGHSKEIIDGWAKSFAEMAVSDDPKKIRPKEFPISIIKL